MVAILNGGWDIIMNEHHPRTITEKVGLILHSGFRSFNCEKCIMYDKCQVMAMWAGYRQWLYPDEHKKFLFAVSTVRIFFFNLEIHVSSYKITRKKRRHDINIGRLSQKFPQNFCTSFFLM